jgi:hypothetical protein
MIQLKRTYGEKVLGVMIYIKPEKGTGVRNPELAGAYCYPFDTNFYCISEDSKNQSPVWEELISAIEKFLKS